MRPLSAWRWGIVALVLVAHHLSLAGANSVCTGPEDYRIPDGRDYRGSVDHTVSGLQCQPWAAQSPHTHDTPVDPSLGTSGEGNRFCRNPESGSTGPGCYTMSPSTRFELCDVGPVCDPNAAPQVSLVSVSPSSGQWTLPVTITLSCGTLGASLYYTTNGSPPDATAGTLYEGPFQLTAPTGPLVLRAVGVKLGYRPSAIASVAYELTHGPLSPVEILPPADPNTVFRAPVLVSLVATPTVGVNPGSEVLRFTTDGTVPDVTARQYTKPFWMKEPGTVRAIATFSGRSPSEVAVMRYFVVAPKAAKPSVLPVMADGAAVYGEGSFTLVSPLTAAEFEVSINGTIWLSLAEAQAWLAPNHGPYTPNVLRVTVHGATTLQVRVSDPTTAPSDSVTWRFSVRDIPAVSVLPAPSGTLYGPVNVTAFFAEGGNVYEGLPIEVMVDGAPVGPSFSITQPGDHTVVAFGRSQGRQGPVTQWTYKLRQWTLSAPDLYPDPDTAFPAGFRFSAPLTVTLPAVAQVDGVSYEATVSHAFGGASDAALYPAYRAVTLRLAEGITHEDDVTLVIRVVPTDPASAFLIPSPAIRREFRLAPTGDRRTPLFRLPIAVRAALLENRCNEVERAVGRALFLASAQEGTGGGAQVHVHRCGIRPSFRVSGLAGVAVGGYTRLLLAWLANGASPLLESVRNTTAAEEGPSLSSEVASLDAYVDVPTFEDGCRMLATTTSVPLTAEGANQRPAMCSAQACGQLVNPTTRPWPFLSALITDGGKRCGCLTNAELANTGLPAAEGECNVPCAASAGEYCGGSFIQSSQAGVAASVYANVDVESPQSAVRLFTAVYEYRGVSATTTAPFDLEVVMANLPDSAAASVKLVLANQQCATLAREYALVPLEAANDGAPMWVAKNVLLQQSGTYQVCIALSTDTGVDPAGVYGPVPAATGHTVTVLQGDDAPVQVTPASGTYGVPLTVTATCATQSSTLVLTLDGQDPVSVAGPSHSFSIATPGQHLLSVHAVVGGQLIGVPVSRVYTVTTETATPAPPFVSTRAPPTTSAPATGASLGVIGYTAEASSSPEGVALSLAVVGQLWFETPCASNATEELSPCQLYVLPAGTTHCGTIDQAHAGLSVSTGLVRVDDPTKHGGVVTVRATNAVSLLAFPFAREKLRVCLALPGPHGDGMAIDPISPTDTLSSATQGLGQCTAGQENMCQHNARCAARLGGRTPEVVCICDSTETAGDPLAQASVICSQDEVVPAKLKGRPYWDGSLFALETQAPEGSGSSEENQPKGSWVSFVVLASLFAISTASLCYIKRTGAGDWQNGSGGDGDGGAGVGDS